MQLFISVLHQILFTVIAVMLVGIVVGGWPPWIYNRNKKQLIKCHNEHSYHGYGNFFITHAISKDEF